MTHAQQAVDRELLEATAAAIARHGLAGLTLDRVAQAAGVSRATMYRRAISREQLIAALTTRAAEQFQAALLPALTAAGSAAERMRMALHALCATADANLPLLGGLFLSHGEVFHQAGPGALTVDVFAGPFERLLRDGALDGSLRTLEPVVTATVLFNTVGWGYVHLRASHHWPADQARDSVVELALAGLTAS